MTYRVIAYIRVDPDEEILHSTMEEAEADAENLMQPEDMHIIEEVPDEESW